MKKLLLLSLIWVALGGYAQTTTFRNITLSDSAATYIFTKHTHEQKAILVVADTIPQQGVYQLAASGIVEAQVYNSRIRWQFGYVVQDYMYGTATFLNSKKEKLPEGWVVLFYKPEDWK